MKKIQRRRWRSEQGFISMFIAISLGLVMIFGLLLYAGFQQIKTSTEQAKEATAYYAAEGGLQRALCNLEKGLAEGYDTSGALGAGFYHTTVSQNGMQWLIVSRGYFGSDEGKGKYKNIIKYGGHIMDNHFILESWQKMP